MKQDQITSTGNKLWQDIKQQYNIVENADIREKLNHELAEWRKNVKRSFLVEKPFYDDEKVLLVAQQSYKDGDYSKDQIENDLKEYSQFKKKIHSKVKDFWKAKLGNLTREQSTEYLELQSKLNSNQNQNLDNLIKQLLESGHDVESAFKELKDADQTTLSKLGKLPKDAKLKQQINRINNEHQTKQSELQGLRGSLLKEWQQELDEAIAAWELKQLEEFRKKIFAQLTSWLDLLSRLFNVLDDLSLEPGLLFDLSKGELTAQDIKDLQKWVEYIEKDEGVKQLCDMLGKLRKASQSEREEAITTTRKITIQVPDSNSKEEITGIVLGNDIENVIPEELALLADEDTSDLFDLKYIEKRLLCFENQGFTDAEFSKEEIKKIQVTEDDKMGPIIVCVDTSGSMSGTPETIAKAITLYMATRAIQQDRDCYLINFSTGIKTFDFSGGLGLKDLLNFLKMSFHGGTDVNPALQEALRQLETDGYKQADVLTISDFVMNDLTTSITTEIAKAKDSKNNFYSLCIGNYFYDQKLRSIFDKSWVYNSQSMKIHELSSFMESLD